MNEKFTRAAFFSRSLLVSLLIPFTFACTGLSIFTANSMEMPGTIATLLPLLCILIGLVALFIFFVQLPFLLVKKNWFIPVNTFLFGCGLLLWLQANVFNWNFGELDGTGIDWQAFRHLMVLEIVVYATIIGLIFWKRQHVHKYVIHLSCMLIFMQIVPLVEPVRRELSRVWSSYDLWKQFEITYDGFFDYSKEQNVLLVIPDAFSSEIFHRMIEKHPEILDWFSDFNYFPKQKSQGKTPISIPEILTACNKDLTKLKPKEFTNELRASMWNSEGALQKTLTEAGFQSRIYAWTVSRHYWEPRWISNIRHRDVTSDSDMAKWRWGDRGTTEIGPFADFAIVRSLPIVCKPSNFETFRLVQQFFPIHTESEVMTSMYKPLRSTDDIFFSHIVIKNPASAMSSNPVLNVIHFRACHARYNFNEKFEREEMHGIDGEERQTFAAILLLKRLIEHTKAVDVYDNTLIVIAADHGLLPNKGTSYTVDSAQFYNPLLLIKRKNEKHNEMVYRSEYTNVQDITPTILDLVGIEIQPNWYSDSAHPIFNMSPEISEQRKNEYETFWAEKDKEVR